MEAKFCVSNSIDPAFCSSRLTHVPLPPMAWKFPGKNPKLQLQLQVRLSEYYHIPAPGIGVQ